MINTTLQIQRVKIVFWCPSRNYDAVPFVRLLIKRIAHALQFPVNLPLANIGHDQTYCLCAQKNDCDRITYDFLYHRKNVIAGF